MAHWCLWLVWSPIAGKVPDRRGGHEDRAATAFSPFVALVSAEERRGQLLISLHLFPLWLSPLCNVPIIATPYIHFPDHRNLTHSSYWTMGLAKARAQCYVACHPVAIHFLE